MNNNCLQGNTWSFDSTFLFVGSVATTIGLIQIDPASSQNWSQIFNTNIESIRLWKCYTKNQARKDNLHDIYRNDLKNPKSPLRLKIPAFWWSGKVISIPFFAILLNMISDLVESRLEFSGQDSRYSQIDGQKISMNISVPIPSQWRNSKAYELFQNGYLIIVNVHIHGSSGTLRKSSFLTSLDPIWPFNVSIKNRIGYICLGICLFILVPAYFFAIIEQWSYLGMFSFCNKFTRLWLAHQIIQMQFIFQLFH